jgi:hypothetical protein
MSLSVVVGQGEHSSSVCDIHTQGRPAFSTLGTRMSVTSSQTGRVSREFNALFRMASAMRHIACPTTCHYEPQARSLSSEQDASGN